MGKTSRWKTLKENKCRIEYRKLTRDVWGKVITVAMYCHKIEFDKFGVVGSIQCED